MPAIIHVPMPVDITKPESVEVLIRGDGSVLWVNVDGVCALRICQMGTDCITINDERVQKP